MKIALGADHGGYQLKESLKAYLRGRYLLTDFGTNAEEVSVDYAAFAHAVGEAVARRQADIGILICKSGNGVAIAANKSHGVRAVNCHDPEEAVLARQHNNANVLTLSGERRTDTEAKLITDAFLRTEFEGGRHQRRVEEIEGAKYAA